MLRLSVNELSTPKWTIEEDVIHYHEAGFSALGIWYPKLAEYGKEKAIELLNEYGFTASSINYVGEFTGGNSITFRHGLIQALDVIQSAADIGAKTVVLSVGTRNGHTRNHALRILSKAVEVLAEAAQAVRVQLALEPVHLGCTGDSILNTIPQCLDLISKVDNPNLGIAFDCYHLTQDSTSLSLLENCVQHIQLVQLGDAKHAPMGRQNRCLLGHGKLPLLDTILHLQQQSYDGFYEIELQGAGVEHLDYKQLLGQSHRTTRLWQEQSRLIANSLQYSVQRGSK